MKFKPSIILIKENALSNKPVIKRHMDYLHININSLIPGKCGRPGSDCKNVISKLIFQIHILNTLIEISIRWVTLKLIYNSQHWLKNWLVKCSNPLLELVLTKIHDASRPQRVNSSPPSVAYMCQWIRSVLVQIMACQLFSAKPSS